MLLQDSIANIDTDIEKAILSSSIHSEDILLELITELSPSDFSLDIHSKLFEAIIKCYEANEPIAPSFIKKYVDIEDELLLEIISTTTLVDVSKYCAYLKELSIKRKLMNLIHQIPSKLNKDTPLSTLLDDINKSIFSITSSVNARDIKDINVIVEELLDNFKLIKEQNRGDVLGLDTGFSSLNKMIRGFKDGDLIIIAARPGMGKTSICLNFIDKALKNDQGVVFFSLEMPAVQILQRMLALKTSIPLQKIITADLNDLEWEQVSNACDEYSKKVFYVYDNGYASVNDISAVLRRLKKQHKNIKLCVVDYIGLMMGLSKFQDRHLQVAEISRSLKLLARELEMPVIALSQLNRSLESRSNKRPMLSDLRESGAIEQDADSILFVYRDEEYKEQEEKEKMQKAKLEGKEFIQSFREAKLKEEAELIVGKNRNGPTGTVKLIFNKECSSFHEVAQDFDDSLPRSTTKVDM